MFRRKIRQILVRQVQTLIQVLQLRHPTRFHQQQVQHPTQQKHRQVVKHLISQAHLQLQASSSETAATTTNETSETATNYYR